MTYHGESGTVADSRARTYAILSALYTAAPTQDLVATIRTGGLLAEGASAPLTVAANELSDALRDVATPGSYNDLAAEHTRLFVLPSGVMPHESMYLDQNKRLGGRITAGVRRCYEEAAAELTKACLELPDHMGVELEFMSFLCGIEAQLRKQPDAAGLKRCLGFQHDFLAEHLLRWYQPLCERVLRDSASGTYRALAKLTVAFLKSETQLVPQIIDELDTESRTLCVSES